MSAKVVVTGLNFISSLGSDWRENWQNLISGKSGIKRITTFDPGTLETQIAGEVNGRLDELVKKYCTSYQIKNTTKVSRMAFVCAKQCLEEMKLDFALLNKARCAVICGIVSTGYSSIEQQNTKGNRIIKAMNNAVGAWISLEYGLEGPCYSIATACASSAYALAAGYDLIRSGGADLVIVGGADSIINPEELSSFNKLFALSTRNNAPEEASRPFSVDRDGFVAGEGAGIIVLESEASAQKRNADILAEFCGHGLTSEAYNIVSPRENGEGMAQTMRLALENSRIDKRDIGYINAHGTSTTMNDKCETLAIKSVFGDQTSKLKVSSSKSMIGHTIGAAGVIESAITILSVKDGILTPTINYNPDPELDLDYVPNIAHECKVDAAISNSFGFGGHNASLIFRKYR